jgi:hypothetical protein
MPRSTPLYQLADEPGTLVFVVLAAAGRVLFRYRSELAPGYVPAVL